MDRQLAAHGLVLSLPGLLTELIGSELALLRLGRAAHTIALLGKRLHWDWPRACRCWS